MSTIKELNEAINTLNIDSIKAVLSKMSDTDVSAVNQFPHFNGTVFDAMPYDVALKSTVRQFLKTGNYSVIDTCIQILMLLEAKGWNGIIINNVIGKVADRKLITLHHDHPFYFRDYANFVQKLNEAVSAHTFQATESIKDAANELETFLHSNPDPLCWKKKELDRMAKQLVHIKGISAVCEQDEKMRCTIK